MTMVISRDSETILVFLAAYLSIYNDHSSFSKTVLASLRIKNQYAITSPFKSFLSAFEDYIVN